MVGRINHSGLNAKPSTFTSMGVNYITMDAPRHVQATLNIYLLSVEIESAASK